MCCLQRDRSIDGGGGAASASFGAEKSKNASLSGASRSARATRREAGQSLKQSVGSSRIVDVFPGAGPHAGDDAGGMRHLAVGKDGNLQRSGANEFDGANGALGIVLRNVNDDNFGARILKLAENCVGGANRKSDVAEDRPAQACRFQTNLQRG